MKALHTLVKKTRTQWQCHAWFALFLLPLAFTGYCLPAQSIWFSLFLLPGGWFCWTYVEYIYHRFWSHDKKKGGMSALQHLHQYHHSHPWEIKVTGWQRLGMLLVSAVQITAGIIWFPWLLLLAGFWTGFSWFCLMHYFLHQSWAPRVFPQLVSYHIVHHCRRPDLCFGVSCSFWDKVFGTIPVATVVVSDRIRSFYFNNHQKRA